MKLRPWTVALLALCLLPSLANIWLFWQSYPGDLFAPNHQLVVRDYLNVWAGGRLARMGRLDILFDPPAYANWLWSLFGPRLDLHSWGYPPHLLLLAVPFSLVPLVPGFVLWTVATGLFLFLVMRRAARLPAWCALAVVLSPAGIENALVGQNGALIAAALAGGLLMSGRRPVAAAALLALLTLKPQLGLLVPVCLIARRDWRTIAWTVFFSVAYCAAGLALFGWPAWQTYVTVTAPFMRSFIEAPFGLAAHYMMVPPFIGLRAAGASLAVAYAGQAIASVLCIALAAWAWSRRGVDRRIGVALVLCLAPLATPYAHSYDLVAVAAACALLADASREAGGLALGEILMLAPAWLWPGSAFIIGRSLAPGLGSLCVALAAWAAARRLMRGAGSRVVPSTYGGEPVRPI